MEDVEEVVEEGTLVQDDELFPGKDKRLGVTLPCGNVLVRLLLPLELKEEVEEAGGVADVVTRMRR